MEKILSQSSMKKSKGKFKNEYLWGWGMSIIPILGFVIFGLLPILFSVYISFHTVNGFMLENAEFSGFYNFRFIFTDEKFYWSILNTLLSSLSVPISMVFALITAVLINGEIRGKKGFRLIFFIPYVCSVVALSTMWKWLLNEQFGIINDVLRTVFKVKGPDWINTPATFMPSMIIMNVWSSIGFSIILYSAALTNVNKSCYEAAEIDGAGIFTKFFKITLPGISPTSFYIFVMGTIGALQDFARFQIMAPNPDKFQLTVVYYLYDMGFKNFLTYGLGLASAVAWVLAVMIAGVTVLNFTVSKKLVSYD